MSTIWYEAKVFHSSGMQFGNLMTSHHQMSGNMKYAVILKIFKISEKSNGGIIAK